MYCPAGRTDSVPCEPGTFQRARGQSACLPCPDDFQCVLAGTVDPVQCPEGRTNPLGSAAACGDCNYDTHYYKPATNSCVRRTVPMCNEETHYEVASANNRTQERTCRALTPCRIDVRLTDESPILGRPAGVATFEPLQEYVTVMNTRYSDRQCWAWEPCGADDYVEQMPVDDGKGFLVKPLICKRLSMPGSAGYGHRPQYKLVDGSATRDRDNVWVDCKDCTSAGRYQALPCSYTEDSVCREYTQCDPFDEYVVTKGAWDADNVCAPRTRCTASSSRSMYEMMPAVDSTDPRVNGSDAVCAPYSSCGGGHYTAFAGNDTHDVICLPCPPGMYRPLADENSSALSVYASCLACPAGKYSSAPGGLECLPCTDCARLLATQGKNSTNQTGGPFLHTCPFAPADQHCTPAAWSPCTAEADAKCTMCAALSELGGFSVSEEGGQLMCTPCRPGYVYNRSDPVEGRRCVQCPAGFFCPSMDRAYACPGSIVLPRSLSPQPSGAASAVVPASNPGSWKVDQCSCSSASIGGGFEAPRFGFAAFGCSPCPNGTFAAPGMASCSACPAGTYAAQYIVQATKPLLPDSFHSAIGGQAAAAQDSAVVEVAGGLFAAVRGASSCTSCPADRPYTWASAQPPSSSSSSSSSTTNAQLPSSLDDCHACPEGYFSLQSRWYAGTEACRPCSKACNYPYEYETAPCTPRSDRQCSICALDQCDPVTEIPLGLQGCPGPVDAGRACAPCSNKPENSLYVSAGDDAALSGQTCTWKCTVGYFYSDDEGSCVRCKEVNAGQCKPGFFLDLCSSETNEDSSCSRECDPDEFGKPLDGSEWVWTTYASAFPGMGSSSSSTQAWHSSPGVVQNPTGGLDGKPNIGCMWKCMQGYTLEIRHAVVPISSSGDTGEQLQGVAFCVQESA